MEQLNLPHIPHMPHMQAWNTLTRGHIPVLKMFFLYALPLSVLPPVMLHYAGVTYGGVSGVPTLNELQLQTVGVVFFIAELAMTFLVAWIIQQLGSFIDIKPAYEDAYKLAVLAPTPLWLAPLFLFIPSFLLNLAAASAALVLSAMLIYYGVPDILKIEERGHAILMSGSILSVGLVAWVAMMILTLITWSWVTSSLMLLI